MVADAPQARDCAKGFELGVHVGLVAVANLGADAALELRVIIDRVREELIGALNLNAKLWWVVRSEDVAVTGADVHVDHLAAHARILDALAVELDARAILLEDKQIVVLDSA